jgi:hypothetical protein
LSLDDNNDHFFLASFKISVDSLAYGDVISTLPFAISSATL